jgi:nucleoside-diphosphate-sugar epimerase
MFTVSEGLLRSVARFSLSQVPLIVFLVHFIWATQKIQLELGWSPPFTLQEGLQATAKWYRTIVKSGLQTDRRRN